MQMASTSKHTDSTNKRIIPKADPNSVAVTRANVAVDAVESAVDVRLSLVEYITNTFGTGRTESEIEFVNEFDKTGRLSCRLLIIYIFTLWYIGVVQMHYYVDRISDHLLIRCEIPALEPCKTFNFSTFIDISVGHNKPTFKDVLSTEYCTYSEYDYYQLVLFYGCNSDKIINVVHRQRHLQYKICSSLVKNVKTNYSNIFRKKTSTTRSIKAQFDLFCDRTGTFLFWASLRCGYIVSVLFVGFTADIFGRKPAFMIVSLLHLLGFLILFVPLRWCMVLGRFLSGAGRASQVILFILFLELCNNVTLLWMGLLLCLIFPITNATSYLLYYSTYQWRIMHLLNTCMLFPLPFGLWYLTESPRWLMFVGKKAKAWKTLRDCGSTAEPSINDLNAPEAKRPTLGKLSGYLCQPIFGQRIVICFIVWFFSATSLFIHRKPLLETLSYGSDNVVFIVAAFELFVESIGSVAAIRFGSRTAVFGLYCLLMLLDSVVFMENPDYKENSILPMMLCCHYAISVVVFQIMMFYTSELFPTPYRATAVCNCVTMFEIGSIIRQYVFQKAFITKGSMIEYFPLFISTIACALMICLLPKTRNRGLPDTHRQALYLKNII